MCKPFVRVWNTVSEFVPEVGKTSDAVAADNDIYYVDTEADRRQVNVHVENRYWLAEQPTSGRRTWAATTTPPRRPTIPSRATTTRWMAGARAPSRCPW